MDWSDQLSVERYQETLPDLTDTMSAGTLVTATYGNLRKLANSVNLAVQDGESSRAEILTAVENIGNLQLTEEQLASIQEGLADQIMVAVVNRLAPQLQRIEQIAQALGAIGPILSELSEPAE